MPQISEAEWEVMRVLWEKSPQAAEDVVAELEKRADWKPATVKTLLNRLVAKKAIGYEKNGRRYLYRPLVGEKECVRHESRSFLDRLFGGSLAAGLAHFVESGKLSRSEIEELKRILKEKGR